MRFLSVGLDIPFGREPHLPTKTRSDRSPGSLLLCVEGGLERTLGAIVDQADPLEPVPKADLYFGDWVRVTTLDAIYSIHVLEGGLSAVSDGWFDRHGLSPCATTINGCTWGGSSIKVDILAALGLHLEFGSGLLSSPIQKVEVISFEGKQVH